MSRSIKLANYIPVREKYITEDKKYKFISKKIFQTWETDLVSEDMFEAVSSWINNNPEWEYYFFDIESRRNFIKNNFAAEILNAYDALIPGAYKADLWRYCVLYIYGGVYIDIKAVSCGKLDELLDECTQFTSVKERYGASNLKSAVLNSFICCEKKHPFLKKSIDVVVQNVRESFYGKNALYPTGPFALGRAMNLVLGRKHNSKFRVGLQKINNIKFTLWFFSNKHLYSQDLKIATIYTDKSVKHKCFHARYLSYSEEKNILAHKSNETYDYAFCWRNCSIYTTKLDESKTLYPTIYKIKNAYNNNDKQAARKMLFVMVAKYRKFSWKLLRCYLQGELMLPVTRLYAK